MKKHTSLTLFLSLSLSVLAGCGGGIEGSGTGGPGSPGPKGPTEPTPGAPGPGHPGTAPTPTTPVAPTPTGSWDSKANGCGDFVVYASHSSGTKFLVVDADKKALGIEKIGESSTVDFSTRQNAAKARVDVYSRAPAEAIYCSDIIIDPQTPVSWTAVAGTATFTITSFGREGGYAVTVSLKSVVVQSPDGRSRESVPDLTYSNVFVGWLPG